MKGACPCGLAMRWWECSFLGYTAWTPIHIYVCIYIYVCMYVYIYIYIILLYEKIQGSVLSLLCSAHLLSVGLGPVVTPGRLKACWTRRSCWHDQMYSCKTSVHARVCCTWHGPSACWTFCSSCWYKCTIHMLNWTTLSCYKTCCIDVANHLCTNWWHVVLHLSSTADVGDWKSFLLN